MSSEFRIQGRKILQMKLNILEALLKMIEKILIKLRSIKRFSIC